MAALGCGAAGFAGFAVAVGCTLAGCAVAATGSGMVVEVGCVLATSGTVGRGVGAAAGSAVVVADACRCMAPLGCVAGVGAAHASSMTQVSVNNGMTQVDFLNRLVVSIVVNRMHNPVKR